jgi:hypothetical protein
MSRRLAILAMWSSLAAAPAAAQSFADAPVSCGSLIQYKTCTAAFDGQTLRVTHAPPEGKPTLAIYRHCVATSAMIHCPVGRWESDGASTPLGARSLGLRNGLPFRD